MHFEKSLNKKIKSNDNIHLARGRPQGAEKLLALVEQELFVKT